MLRIRLVDRTPRLCQRKYNVRPFLLSSSRPQGRVRSHRKLWSYCGDHTRGRTSRRYVDTSRQTSRRLRAAPGTRTCPVPNTNVAILSHRCGVSFLTTVASFNVHQASRESTCKTTPDRDLIDLLSTTSFAHRPMLHISLCATMRQVSNSHTSNIPHSDLTIIANVGGSRASADPG